jgi:tetraacyldisaccharide 4'-kinase
MNTLERAALWAPTKLYELGVRLRVAAYETGYLSSRRLTAPVISVGNITVGGTGKTPLVEYVARYLKEEGYSVAILTRGYGRQSRGQRILNPSSDGTLKRQLQTPSGTLKRELQTPSGTLKRELQTPSGTLKRELRTDRNPRLKVPRLRPELRTEAEEFGDEPIMLARALPDIPIVINKDRFEGGRYAEQELGSQVLVLDDGYQHMQLARDLNLLVLDATDPFGSFQMTPLGRLREPLYGIRRANAVVVTRAHRPFDQAQLLSILSYYCGDKVPVMYVASTIPRLRLLNSEETFEASEFRGWNCFVMCGIGNPRAFSDDLLQIGINVAGEHFFRDHHRYNQEDLDGAVREARQAGADLIVTTDKDAVRLGGLTTGDMPLYSAQQELQTEDEVRLKSLILRTITIGVR